VGRRGRRLDNEYAADVTGLNGHDGDATWAGDAGGLTLAAQGDIFDLTVGGWVSLDAGQDVGDVTAGTVDHIFASGSVGSVTAAGGIGDVWAQHGSVSGEVTTTAGSVGDVTAGTDVTGRVTAAVDVGRVTAGRNISGGVSAGRDVAGVAAGTAGPVSGDLGGDVTAGRSMGFVFASRDITGALTAETGNIGWVGEPVLSARPDTELTAVPAGGVAAGRNITADIRASAGGVAPVHAGALVDGPDEGWLTGDVVAGKYDLAVFASGDVSGALQAAAGSVLVVAGGGLSGTVSAVGGTASVEVMSGVSATVTGQFGVTVAAEGSVAGLILAGDDDHLADATVSSLAAVPAAVTASYNVSVSASGSVSGPVGGLGAVGVTAGGDVSGTVTSRAGGVEVRSGGSVLAAVTGAEDVLVAAAGDVAGPVAAGDLEDDVWGEADVVAGGNVTGRVSAAAGVRVSAGGNVTGDVATVINEAAVSAGGNVTGGVTGDYAVVEGGDIGGTVTAALGVEARAHGQLSGNLLSEGGAIWAQVAGAVSGYVTAGLEVYVEAGGDVSGAVTAGAGGALANALVRSSGEVAGNVVATASSEVWAVSGISGDVRAGDGEAVALTIGAVQGVVHSDAGRIRVWASGGTGRASSGSPGDLGPDWMVAVVNGAGSSLGGLLVVRGNGPEVVAATNLDGPGSPDVLAADDAVGELGQKPRAARPPAAGTPAGMPVAAPADWTPMEFLRRASKVSQWLQTLDPARAERWQQFTKNAPPEELWDVLKSLMEAIDLTSLSPDYATLDSTLDDLIGPPPPEVAPPPRVAGPQAKPGPTPEDLKRWSNEVAAQLKLSAAEADAKIRAANDDEARRYKFYRNRITVAGQFEEEAPRHWIAGWEGTFLTRARELRLEGDRALNSRDFDLPPKGGPVPRTEAGKAQAARDAAEVALLRSIGDMPVTQKLGVALDRAMNAKNPDGSNKLGAELRASIAVMVKPENLAIMGGVIGVAGVATFFGGPAVVSGIGVIGYMFTGQAVLEIGEDLFKFVTTAAGARTSADFDRAADHLIKGLTQGTTELVQNAAGATVAKVAARAIAAKALAGDVAKGAVDPKAAVVQRADGRVEVKLPAEPPTPPVAGGQAAAAAGPLAIVTAAVRKWKGKAPPAPSSLVDDASKVLWKDLNEVLGPEVVQAVTKNVQGDGAKLATALKDLEKISDTTLNWKGSTRPRTLVNDPDKVSALLRKIFIDNSYLADVNTKPEDLLRMLNAISDADGFVSTLKRLSLKGTQVKGVVAEIRKAAKAKNSPNGGFVDINQHVTETVTIRDKATGKDVTQVLGSDIDIIAGGVLWQVKAGEHSLSNLDSFKVWIKVAVERAKRTGEKIGIMLDGDAKKAFDDSPTCKQLVADAKKALGEDKVLVQPIDKP
jgi:hypothetical protein